MSLVWYLQFSDTSPSKCPPRREKYILHLKCEQIQSCGRCKRIGVLFKCVTYWAPELKSDANSLGSHSEFLSHYRYGQHWDACVGENRLCHPSHQKHGNICSVQSDSFCHDYVNIGTCHNNKNVVHIRGLCGQFMSMMSPACFSNHPRIILIFERVYSLEGNLLRDTWWTSLVCHDIMVYLHNTVSIYRH